MTNLIEELEICNSCLKDCVKGYSKLRSELNTMEAGIERLANLLDRGVCELEQDEDGWFIHDIYNDVYITSPDLRKLIMQLGRMK